MLERSPRKLRLVGWLFERDLRRSFHAVRCAGKIPSVTGPVVIVANHASWWDGELFIWLAVRMFANRRCHAPMHAGMLDRYRIFRGLGAFPVSPGYRGAATFLAVTKALLAHDDSLLLVNGEGRFRDVRERPLELLPGLAHLARGVAQASFVPLAVEYAFWDERRPNLLLRFGEPVTGETIRDLGARVLCDTLLKTMDRLAADAISREPARFTTLLAGKAGINPAYDAWRRLRAALRGRRFDPAHRAAAEER